MASNCYGHFYISSTVICSSVTRDACIPWDTMAKTINKIRKAAYGRPKSYARAGKIINAGSLLGVRIVQVTSLRPFVRGYDSGRRP